MKILELQGDFIKFMRLTSLKNNFKAHPLWHTITLSTLMHLVAFSFFPNWDSSTKPEKEKTFRVKFIQEKAITPEKILPKVSEKKIVQKHVEPKNIPEKISPNQIPKSAIIKSAKLIKAPPHSAKRTPVPIHNSQQMLKPVNIAQKRTSISQPVLKYKQAAPVQSFELYEPSARITHEVQLKQSTPATQLAMTADEVKPVKLKSFKPSPRLKKASASTKLASLNPELRAKSLTELNFENSLKPSFYASSKFKTENRSSLKTAANQKPFPVAPERMPLVHKPVTGVKEVDMAKKYASPPPLMARKPQTLNESGSMVHVRKNIKKPLAGSRQTGATLAKNPQRLPFVHKPATGVKGVDMAKKYASPPPLMARKPQAMNEPGTMVRVKKNSKQPFAGPGRKATTQAKTPKTFDTELVAQYQPAIPIAANHFSSQSRSFGLLKEAAIPSGFSDEKLNRNDEVTTRSPEKVARLGDVTSDLPSNLLKQIKNGFSTKIRNRIAQVKYYPRIARKRGFVGQPVVEFTLGNRGELLELSIVKPSPFKLLDKAALDAVKSARPYPPIPELLKTNSMKFNLPISFMLEER